MAGYDHIAPYYDALKRLVFGRSLENSQLVYLNYIKSSDHVLILGGGTGLVLDHLDQIQIEYVELSGEMIRLASLRKCASHVNFHQIKFEAFESDQKYDVVVANYFLDLFTDDDLPAIINKIKSLMRSEGILLVSDFRPTGNWHHKMLEWAMHKFFKLTTGLNRNGFALIFDQLTDAGFETVAASTYHDDFVLSKVLRRSSS